VDYMCVGMCCHCCRVCRVVASIGVVDVSGSNSYVVGVASGDVEYTVGSSRLVVRSVTLLWADVVVVCTVSS